MTCSLILKIASIIGSLIASIKGIGIILTIKKCDNFQKYTFPKYWAIIEYANKNGINISKIVQFKNERHIRKPYKPHPQTPHLLDMAMDLFNDMDSFAAYFVHSKIMNNYIAYKSQGKAFCDMINGLKNIYMLFIELKGEDYYNLSALYDMWKNKR